jgi:hypothetical protein
MKHRLLFLWILVFSLRVSSAQDVTVPSLVTPIQPTLLYSGPGITYQPILELLPGQLLNVIERTVLGTWVRLWQVDSAGNVVIDGWLPSHLLYYQPAYNLFTDTAINTQIRDGDPNFISNALEAVLYGYRILPPLKEEMRAVYERGIANGHNPYQVTRVGDSLLISEWYLLPMHQNTYNLGRFGYLEQDMRQFGMYMDWSIANQRGLSTYNVFDSGWAGAGCMVNETPIACEYRIKKPIAAFIMFGPNDVKINARQDYHENLRRIVQFSIDQGVIPVLMTFSSHPAHQWYQRTIDYNLLITQVAMEYRTPLINVWLATRTMQDYGLEQDLLHLRNPGFTTLNIEDAVLNRSGVALLNWLSLAWIHQLRQQFGN